MRVRLLFRLAITRFQCFLSRQVRDCELRVFDVQSVTRAAWEAHCTAWGARMAHLDPAGQQGSVPSQMLLWWPKSLAALTL